MDDFEELRRDRAAQEIEGYLQLVNSAASFGVSKQGSRQQILGQAVVTLDRLDLLYQADPESIYLRGQVYRTSQRYQDAIECFQQVRSDFRNDLNLWLALAWCYKRTGRVDLAIESLEEAKLVDPSEAIIHFNLACYWSLEQQPDLAINCLRDAIQLDPKYRDLVAEESDFDPIRDHSSFVDLLGLPA